MEVEFDSVSDEVVEAAVEYLNDEYDGSRYQFEEKGRDLRIRWGVFEPDDPEEYDPTVLGKSSGTVRTVGTLVRKEKVREIAEERGIIESED